MSYTAASQGPPGASRSWARDHFWDHPGLKDKNPEAFHGIGLSAKAKVWCKLCFAARLAREKESDAVLRRVREEKEIENYCEYAAYYRRNWG